MRREWDLNNAALDSSLASSFDDLPTAAEDEAEEEEEEEDEEEDREGEEEEGFFFAVRWNKGFPALLLPTGAGGAPKYPSVLL